MSSARSLPAARRDCSFCPKLCRHACPVAEVERSEQATPTFKQQVAYEAERGVRALDPQRARVLYKCTDCASSVTACRHRIDVGASLREARTQAVAQGLAPAEVEWLARRFRATGSPYSADLQALRAELVGRAPTRGARTLVPSCAELVHEPAEVQAALALLEESTPGVAVAAPEPACCGYPLLALGLSEAFRLQARRYAESLAGSQELIMGGAACAWTLRTAYPDHGVRVPGRVRPLAAALAERPPLRAASPTRVAYHDPCFLCRRLGQYGPPRELIRARTGTPPLELGWHRAESICSGGGGGYPLTHREQAKSCASRVGALLRETDAELLVTGCPSAARRLREAEPALPVSTLAAFLRS